MTTNTAPNSYLRDSPRSQLRYLPRLLAFIWRAEPATVALLVLISAGAGLLVVAEVHALRRLVETAQEVIQGGAPLIDAVVWAGLFAGLGFVQAGAFMGKRLIGDHFQEVVRGVIEARCYRQAQSMPLSSFERAEHHDRLTRALRGMDQRFFSTFSFMQWMITHVVAILSLLVYLAQFHWAIPLVLAAGTTPGVLIRERQHHARYRVGRKQTPRQRRLEVLSDIITGRSAAAELRLFGFGPWLIDRAEKLWLGMRDERMQLEHREFKLEFVTDGINGLVTLATIGFGVFLLIAGRVSLGATAAFFAAIDGFQQHYWGLVWNASIIYNDLRYIRDFFEFIDSPRLDFDKGTRLPGPISRRIELDKVSFTYPGSDRPALADVSVTLRPGERIALVGENGAGKTTLAKILMGLYEPTSGRIVVDGVDLKEMALADWYRRIGAVFQDFTRYQVSLRENIGFGWLPKLDDAEAIASAAARSGAAEVASSLPRGLETPLGKEFQEGSELSVGQWQRLAIARAYLRPAEVLILDEPASGLDAKAEAGVYDHFARMAEASTVVLISHRLGSCRLADRILVLNEGRVVEQGSHSQLIAAGGEYAELFKLQAGWYR